MNMQEKLKAMRRQSRKIAIPKMRIVEDKTKYNRKKLKNLLTLPIKNVIICM